MNQLYANTNEMLIKLKIFWFGVHDRICDEKNFKVIKIYLG